MTKLEPLKFEPPLELWTDDALLTQLHQILVEVTTAVNGLVRTVNELVDDYERRAATEEGQARAAAFRQRREEDGN